MKERRKMKSDIYKYINFKYGTNLDCSPGNCRKICVVFSQRRCEITMRNCNQLRGATLRGSKIG